MASNPGPGGVLMTARPATVAALVFAVLVAGCGKDEKPESAAATPAATTTATATPTATPEQAKGKDCAGDLDGDPKRQPPPDLGVLSYSHLYKSERPSARTERFYAVLDGTPGELPSRRDDAQNELVQNFGFASLRTSDKQGEAGAHLENHKYTVDLQVTVLCEGKLRLRYTVR